MATQGSSRLGPDDWLAAGLTALADTGPEALKAEPLSARLKVSKGSFYWHFRDVPDFQAAVITAWEARLRADLVAATAPDQPTDQPPVARLRALVQFLGRTDPVEPAMRGWGHSNDTARQAVDRADAARFDLLHSLLRDIGIRNSEMARLIQATAIGMGALAETDPAERENAMGSLVDLVLALQ